MNVNDYKKRSKIENMSNTEHLEIDNKERKSSTRKLPIVESKKEPRKKSMQKSLSSSSVNKKQITNRPSITKLAPGEPTPLLKKNSSKSISSKTLAYSSTNSISNRTLRKETSKNPVQMTLNENSSTNKLTIRSKSFSRNNNMHRSKSGVISFVELRNDKSRPDEIANELTITNSGNQNWMENEQASLIEALKSDPNFQKLAKHLAKPPLIGKNKLPDTLIPEFIVRLKENQVPLKTQMLFALLSKEEICNLIKTTLTNVINSGKKTIVLNPKTEAKVNKIIDDFYMAVVTNLPSRVIGETIFLNNRKFEPGAQIGAGGFGKIYVGEFPDETLGVFKKMIADEHTTDTEKSAKFAEGVREVSCHIAAAGPKGHKNILGLSGAIQSDGLLSIGLEYAPYRDVANLLDILPKAKLPEEIEQQIYMWVFENSVAGVNHMHKEGVMHMDIKPHNILLGEGATPKICDFGASHIGLECILSRSNVDNPRWLAPEIALQWERQVEEKKRNDAPFLKKYGEILDEFNNYETADGKPEDPAAMEARKSEMRKRHRENDREKNRVPLTTKIHITEKADVWGLGIILYTMVYGAEPPQFSGPENAKNLENLAHYAENSEDRIIPDPGTPVDYLINSMLHPDPQQRPELSQVLKELKAMRLNREDSMPIKDLKNIIMKITSSPPDDQE
jgi:serine/threonine protein kinase